MKGNIMKQNTAWKVALLVGALSFTAFTQAWADEDAGGALPLVSNAKWKEECGSCHMAYHPGLLPERSWRKLMGGLDKHFDQSASLDAATQKEITDFLVKFSAEHSSSKSSAKIARSIPAKSTPERITETTWFKREHHEVGATVWKRPKVGSASNCAACHRTAEKGEFSEHNVKIPR